MLLSFFFPSPYKTEEVRDKVEKNKQVMHGLKTCLTLLILSTTKLHSLPLSSRSHPFSILLATDAGLDREKGSAEEKNKPKEIFFGFYKNHQECQNLG